MARLGIGGRSCDSLHARGSDLCLSFGKPWPSRVDSEDIPFLEPIQDRPKAVMSRIRAVE